jgi:hypothetical protein
MSSYLKRKLDNRSPQAESDSVRMRMEDATGIDYCDKIQVIMDDTKVKVGTTLAAMELAGDQPSAGEFRGWINSFIAI